MKEATSAQKLIGEVRQASRELPTQPSEVLYKSKRNRLKIFVDLGDEEYKGDGDNTRIGEEPERKRVDPITVTNQISLHNTDNDAQQEASHAISAKRSGILRRLVGGSDCHVGDN